MGSLKKKKASVKKMESKYFFDFTKETNFVNLATPIGTNGEKFTWLQIGEFKFVKSIFYFKFRCDIDEDYQTCFLGPKKEQPKAQSLNLDLSMLVYCIQMD